MRTANKRDQLEFSKLLPCIFQEFNLEHIKLDSKMWDQGRCEEWWTDILSNLRAMKLQKKKNGARFVDLLANTYIMANIKVCMQKQRDAVKRT